MKQLSLAGTGFLPEAGKQTRKALFLAEMAAVVPSSRLEALIKPFCPKMANGLPPMPQGTMLRIHFMQQCFVYSDLAMEEALRFRHLLEQHNLATAIFAEVAGVLSDKGLTMKRGTVFDATLAATPSSTKNQDKQRDPEMAQTRKGNQWHFGMKAHNGVDAESGLNHPVECTTAKVASVILLDACLHGEETFIFGDRGYHKANRAKKEVDLSVITPPTKKPAGGKLTDEQKGFNWMLSAARAIIEHPFRVVKRQFGFSKVRYCGLAKKAGQIITQFALANLWLVLTQFFPLMGGVHP